MATTVSSRRTAAAPRRRRWAGLTALGAGTAAASSLLARIIMLVASLVALVIAIGIAFVVLKANPGNSVVSSVHDAARFLVGPFDGLFKPKDPKLAVGINWGLAAIVYLIVGRVISRLLMR